MMIRLFLALSLLSVCQGTSYTNYSKLFTDLFTNYNINLRPVADNQNTINLTIDFAMLSLDSISEQEQTLTTNGWLELSWVDEMLTWNTADYDGITEVLVQQQIIWLPDLSVKNTVKPRKMMGYKEQPAVLTDNGGILWIPGDIYETSCDLIVTYYPFDAQQCKISVNLWISLKYEIELRMDQSSIIMDNFSPNGQWEVVSTNAEIIEVSGVQEAVFTLNLQRRRLFYIVNMIIPIIFLSCLGPLAFYLPADSGEKMGFSVTVLLAYTVFLTLLGDSIPQTSTQTSILSVYLSAMMSISAASVLLSGLHLRLYMKADDTFPPKAVQTFARFLRKILCMRCRSRNGVTPIKTVNKLDEVFEGTREATQLTLTSLEEEITWKMLSETLDMFCLLLSVVLTIVITVVCFMMMMLQP